MNALRRLSGTSLGLLAITTTLALTGLTSAAQAAVKPPKGFTALFNGESLEGWRGGETVDPRKIDAMAPEARAAQMAKWLESMKAHWRVENGELINDGHGAYATTEKDYGDFELLVEYKTVPLADSGIYLRGIPQVQIWDSTEKAKFPLGADKGSGGLWNNSPGAPGKDPLVLADKAFGQWNAFRILMVGARVTVWLNDKLVVDHANLENLFDRSLPVPARGPIHLQTHGGEIRWRNIFIREIGAAEANKLLGLRGDEGFKPIFNGKDLTGWAGAVDEYEVVDGAIRCRPNKGGNLYTEAEYANFKARLEFKLPPAGNNGLAIRYPGKGNPAFDGMCELQVLDNDHPKYKDLDKRQYHGSVYGMIAAHRGYLRPTGEWNFEEVTVQGTKIKVELNGVVILDGDVATVKEFMANHAHPGKDLAKGHLGFAGHNDPVCFRQVRMLPLP